MPCLYEIQKERLKRNRPKLARIGLAFTQERLEPLTWNSYSSTWLRYRNVSAWNRSARLLSKRAEPNGREPKESGCEIRLAKAMLRIGTTLRKLLVGAQSQSVDRLPLSSVCRQR